MDNFDISKRFYEGYQRLTLKQTEKFSEMINLLLEDNYLVYDNMKSDDYEFIVENKELISLYLSLIDIDLLMGLNGDNVIYIKNKLNKNRINLKKLDTIIFLVLLREYIDQNNNLRLNDLVNISFGELKDKLEEFSYITKNNIKDSQIFESLKIFKTYNLIKYVSIYSDKNIPITIYPSISYVIDNSDLYSINKLINALNGGDNDEEIDEVEVD